MAALTIRTGSFARRLAYQEQDSQQTLAQALAEYYRANEGRVLPPESLAPDSAALFASHDRCHVIFGLDTTLEDEAMADTRTLLSCDVGARRYATYLALNKDSQEILKKVGLGNFIWGTVLAVPRIGRAVVEKFRMTKKWPWVPPENYMTRTLADLRREYGIRIV